MNTSITEGQKKQYRRFVEDASEKAFVEASLDKDGLQKLIGNGGEFQSRIITAIKELSVSNQFANEEVESNYGYLSGYKENPNLKENLQDIEKELVKLRQISELSKADYDHDYLKRIQISEIKLPIGAERWTLIPRHKLFDPDYNKSVKRVFTLISEDRNGKFHNYREGKIGSEYLQQNALSIKMWKQIEESQQGGLLIVPAQFGLLHRGRSDRRACEVMNANEFGLGVFTIGIMLLTHPERLKHYDDLYIDCSGDEYSPDADGDFLNAPIFNFNDDQVEFYTYSVGTAYSLSGSASGFGGFAAEILEI